MNFKRRKYSFPSPSPPYNVGPLFQLPIENNKHPNFEWRGQGRVRIRLFSEVTLFKYNVSTILSPIVGCVGSGHLQCPFWLLEAPSINLKFPFSLSFSFSLIIYMLKDTVANYQIIILFIILSLITACIIQPGWKNLIGLSKRGQGNNNI